jgi:hypothetical protein
MLPSIFIRLLLQSHLGECRQDKGSLVDLRIVVLAQSALLLLGPGAQRDLDVAVGVLAADHEANLARRVGRDGSVGILGHREDLAAVLLELGDKREVEPLVLGCKPIS